MNIIITTFIFATVLFIYLHIFYHIKTSSDLEVYEVQNLSKERLEEVCNLRQPLTFYLDTNCFDRLRIDDIKNTYGPFDVKVRDISSNTNSELYLPVVLNKALVAIKDKPEFFSEKNEEFLNETSLIKTLKSNDFFIRPPALMTSEYDYLIGGVNCTTPLRYDMCYRNFLIIIDGEATIKLTPPKNTKYLYTEKDYDNFEFRSPVNPWNPQKEYENDFNKIKCLDVKLSRGKVLFIPSYWWYSIQFNSETTTIINFKYKTYMNNLALAPHYFKYFLQKQNIKHNMIQQISKIES